MQPNSKSIFLVIEKISKGVLDGIVLISSACVVLSLFYLVLARYLFSWPAMGMHTIALISAIWLYMSGALIASRNKQHLVIDYLSQKIESKRNKAIHYLCVSIIQLAITFVFAYWSWRMLSWGMRFTSKYPDFDIPIWVAQSAIAFNAVGCIFYTMRDIYQSYLEIKINKE